MNPEITKIIDQYLQGELSEADRIAFEDRLSASEALQKEVALQQTVYEGARRASVRTQVKQAGKHYHFIKKLQVAAIAAIVIILAATAIVLTSRSSSVGTESGIPEEITNLMDELETESPIDGLKSEFFIWNGTATTALSNQGVLISIPADAFLLDGKPYTEQAVIQWQETLDGATIVKSGLSTMAGDKLLETQGMFGIQAFTPDGKRLEVNSKNGIYIQVPVDDYKSDMQLFEGTKNAAGIIDWKNPSPLMKIPVPVDMALLDFYPKGYEDTLDHLKLRKDKKFRDSLYLSMEHLLRSESSFSTVADTVPLGFEAGKSLFYTKCMTCHNMVHDGTGPALSGVRQKWQDGGAKPASIYQWVQNWEKAAARDPYALKVARMKPTAMSRYPELTEAQINSIFDYVDSQTGEDGIPPSKVLAFWNPKFNNTILATREFERRMAAIYATCNQKVLELYTRNLSKSMVELDKQAAQMGYANFEFFAYEQVGSVDPGSPHLKNLQSFYAKAVGALQREARNNQEALTKKQAQWDQEVLQSRMNEQSRTLMRKVTLLDEEYNFNMRNVQRQLRKTVGFEIHGTGTTYNIDKYVMEATLDRTSTTLIDPATGKTVKINYQKLAFEVENPEMYQKIYAYIFATGVNSYERMPGENGRFSYSFNQDMQYDVAIVGISDKGYSYFQQRDIRQGKLGKIRLEPTSETKLNAAIEQLNSTRVWRYGSMEDELSWLIKEQQDYKEQKSRQDQAAFRVRIGKIVFPCANFRSEAAGIAVPANPQ